MKWLMMVAALYFVQLAGAQQKYRFRSQNLVGVLGGNSDAAIQLQTINGVQRGTWSAGLGVGLDHYYHRTVPLFLSVSKYFSEKPSGIFFFLDGGINFIWDNSTANRFNLFRDDGDFSPSPYYGAHAGYKMGKRNKKGALLMMFGYTGKRLEETLATTLPCTSGPCHEYDEKVNYHLNRYSVKFGWMF